MNPVGQALFLDRSEGFDGPRFALYHPSPGPARASLVYVHPFAEELNRSRRAAALQARSLAAAGVAVLQLDLFGCGDSAGAFEQATLEAWLADLDAAAHWLATRSGQRPGLWGLRGGALLARQALAEGLAYAPRLLAWQPVLDGAQWWKQTQRQLLAGGWQADAQAAEPLALGGYAYHPALRAALPALRFEPPPAPAGELLWLELGAPPFPSPAAARAQQAWRAAGWRLAAQGLALAPFWNSLQAIDYRPLLARSHALWQEGAA